MRTYSKGLAINKKAIQARRLRKIQEHKTKVKGAKITIVFAIVVYTYIAINYFNLI